MKPEQSLDKEDTISKYNSGLKLVTVQMNKTEEAAVGTDRAVETTAAAAKSIKSSQPQDERTAELLSKAWKWTH
ncbi:hypothetical protein L3X38_012907 [Prunus dulcis]|uniref:Uncharacterized protein n=1 Tax=Prunus dulcis TaxID=3755 RepID=A0AAD4WKC2_PRUDU|nr:hypothetical protein L3X38_012907 [Prunus dulcis]